MLVLVVAEQKILKMKKEGDIDCHEIDLLAQDAEYIEFDTRDFEDDKKKETNS